MRISAITISTGGRRENGCAPKGFHFIELAVAALLLPAFSANAQQSASVTPLRVSGGRAHFTAIEPGAAGIGFTNRLAPQRHLTNQILLNGSGVAAGDVDGDGLTDLYFCALDGPNILYRNLGNWSFRDVTAEAGAAGPESDATGAVFADVDGDHDLDLLVSSVGSGTHLFRNNGAGRFTQDPRPLNGNLGGTSMSLADLDGNGTLDLYIANYRTVTLRDQPNTAFRFRIVDGKPAVSTINGRPLTDPDLTNRFTFQFKSENGRASFSSDEQGESDAILLNDGRGGFSPLSFTGGAFLDEDGRPLTTLPFDWGLSVMLRDLNGDGAPDIYVCNDFKSPDRIWINDGKGKFRALPGTAIRQTSLSSMGLDVADINRDGHFDIFAADMLSREHRRRLTQRPDVNSESMAIGDAGGRVQSARNTMLLSRGDGTFAEIAQFSGLQAAEWAWTPIFLDVDLDGFEDLLISNGFERDGMNVDVLREIETKKSAQKLSTSEQLGLRRLFPRLDTPNAAFRNLGNLRFADVSDEWGFNARAVSQGMALADLDNDGDLDVIINNLNGPAVLYRNDGGSPRIAVRLVGNAPNTRGVGAKITVTGGPVTQSQEMICGGRYLSSDDFVRVFATGSERDKMRIEVKWRSGRRTIVEDVRANHLYAVNESAAIESPRPGKDIVAPLFQDVSTSLRHRHTAGAFDDFARQPLLPNKLSQSSPGVSWFDCDGDGWEDLIIGSGRGGQFDVFRNQHDGQFKKMSELPVKQTAGHKLTAVLGWHRSSNEVALLASSSNFEDASPGTVIRQFDLAGKRVLEVLPKHDGTPGPLAMADVDGDGDLDLFAGSRALPGRYPEPPSSRLIRNENGVLTLDIENTRALADVGLVSGAAFSDIDGDGDPDLLLACEWGPIRVFQNNSGQFKEITRELGMEKFRGWWNGVTTGDFDNDGRLDIVASNWGENTKYENFRAQALRIYFGDFDGDRVNEVIEAHYEPSMNSYVPSRNLDAILRGMPWLRPRFPTWSSFSTATVAQVLGDKFPSAKVLEANWLASTVFLNRGSHFEALRLPDEAQFAPAFAVSVADFDGDGHEDIYLGQNFFASSPDTSRYDAGRGLLVRGNGQAGFKTMTGGESGIAVYGEQRGAAVCDFDQDGRADIVATQHGAETKLYRNLTAKPGLRVRLSDGPGNPNGIGALIRIGDGRKLGAAREIHAGAGYLSQDSAVSVLARTGERILVRWPGGKTTVSVVPRAVKEIEINMTGAVTVRH